MIYAGREIFSYESNTTNFLSAIIAVMIHILPHLDVVAIGFQ